MFRRLFLTVCAVSLLASCATPPEDPEGTLDRVTGGTLRVGVTEKPPWTILDDQPTGVEVELVHRLANELDVEQVHFSQGAEHELFDELERGELDLVIGGLLSDSPFSMHGALTTEYYGKHVMAVHHGENGWLVTLEKFLDRESASVDGLLADFSQ